jgi:glycosyltransferase involved in cell wall biosynthesis
MKKRILMISPVPSHPQTAGNRARIYNLALAARELGHELYFAHIEREPADTAAMKECWGDDFYIPIPYTKPNKLSLRVQRKLRSLINKDSKFALNIDDWYDDTVNDKLKKLQQQIHFDIAIVEYAFFSKALTCFPRGVLKILDTHDVLTNRHEIYLKHNYKYNWFATTAAQEKKGLKRADIIIAIQEGEREFFSRLARKRTVTIGHTVKIKMTEKKAASTRSILFIGSANQSNIDAINYFIDEIFPKIKLVIPDAILLVAGAVCRGLSGFDINIIRLGEVIDLDSTYDKCDMVVNPIRFGTGLKIKNIEALGYAKPLVTTSIGAEGMESGKEIAFLLANNAKSFSAAVIKILCEPMLYHSLSEKGYDFARSWNQKQLNVLQEILK